MCDVIKKQHRTIFSMYYHGRFEPGIVSRPNVTIDIDLSELLLLMEAVYGVTHYIIWINEFEKSDVKCKDTIYAYDSLVSEETILCDYKVLKIEVLKEEYLADSYKNIYSYGARPIADLFFYNTLTTNINSSCYVYNRKPYIHFLLYDYHGKKLIKYLKNKLIELIKDICYGNPMPLIKSMINDYNDLEDLYSQTFQQLSRLRNYSNEIRESFNGEFINENTLMNSWIDNRKKYTDISKYSILEFIYGKSGTYHSIALELIYQINKIMELLGFGQLSDTWKRCIDGYDHYNSCPHEMLDIDKELNNLINNRMSASFDLNKWGNTYISKINIALVWGFGI